MPETPGKTKALLASVFWLAMTLAGLVIWFFNLYGTQPARAWHSLLISFIFFTPLSAGLVVWSAILVLTKAHWAGRFERFAVSGVVLALPTIGGIIGLWAGGTAWLPWTVGKPPAWLSLPFYFRRDIAALIIFWIFAVWFLLRRRRGRDSISASLLIFVYVLAFSLLGYDLVMSLNPLWKSALFGAYFFTTGLYVALVAWTFQVILIGNPDRKHLTDFGKLIVGISITTTYLWFCQLLTQWYENLPVDTEFLVPRMNFSPVKAISSLLISLIYLGPLALLLTVRSKQNRWYLGAFSLLLLGGLWVERWWLVIPTLERVVHFGVVDVSMSIAFLGILGLGVIWFRRIWPDWPFEKGEETQ